MQISQICFPVQGLDFLVRRFLILWQAVVPTEQRHARRCFLYRECICGSDFKQLRMFEDKIISCLRIALKKKVGAMRSAYNKGRVVLSFTSVSIDQTEIVDWFYLGQTNLSSIFSSWMRLCEDDVNMARAKVRPQQLSHSQVCIWAWQASATCLQLAVAVRQQCRL